ncbi:MAG: 4-(cytidine 5'-diphospho)-2-C-methyl-D-erythritol kinase [Gemmatimonadetes bacterium]|nr:4-(cytidine 5'-diphospho)-2-C-methyl-D-erythritol kinase [Gemmatimonadota bacterium]
MSASARALAQAKVNLTLRVLARETGGFHQLETVFQRLALADVVTVRSATGRSLDVRWSGAGSAPDLGAPEQNLAWRAADAYAAAFGWPGGFAIEIEKQIPVGGGLGGGSADAAAVLRALDALAPRAVGNAALMNIAARLGADVAFLASPSELALAWGRGERMLDLPPLPAAPVLLVVPDFGVNTAQAYAALAEHRATAAGTAVGTAVGTAGALAPDAAWRSPRTLGSWSAVAADAVNDFEVVVFDDHPELAVVRAQLAALPHSVLAMMSGSGSTLFAVQSGATADSGELKLPDGWRVIGTRTAPCADVDVN